MDVVLGGKLDALRHDLPELPELDNLFAPEVSCELLNKFREKARSRDDGFADGEGTT